MFDRLTQALLFVLLMPVVLVVALACACAVLIYMVLLSMLAVVDAILQLFDFDNII